MGLLAPLFLFGLLGITVPIIIHMIQRERKEVVEFPSLMFVRRIPFRSFRRQRIRHWLLLLLRCAALVLLVMAFARPFFTAASSIVTTGGAREVVILLDRSYSMGYSDRWEQAKTSARDVINGLAGDDRATLLFFDDSVAAGQRSTTDRASLLGMVDNMELGAGVTRYGPALKLAEGIFEASDLPRFEAVFISDFQRAGVESASGVRFPEGTVLTPIPIGIEENAQDNVSVAGVSFQREYFSGRERVVVTARLTNRGAIEVEGLSVALEMDGREVETLSASLTPNGSVNVDFSAVTLGDSPMAGAVRVDSDSLPADDVFFFVVSPGQVVTVLVVGSGGDSTESNLYLTRALGVGSSPSFDVRLTTVEEFDGSDLEAVQMVVLNDTRPPTAQAGNALEAFVRNGGGLLVVAGERSIWPQDGPDLLPGTLGVPIDRSGRGGALGFVDYSHPVFEVFAGPRSGDVSTARFFRYRPVELHPDATVLARFDDGQPALVERRVGGGAVLFWGSSIDSFWNDFAKKPVYLPFVHRLTEYLADYASPIPWFSAGQVLNLAEQEVSLGAGGLVEADFVAVSPSGSRIPISAGDRAGFIELREQGFYEVRDASAAQAEALELAVNVDLAESDLSVVDPQELASTLTGRAGNDRAGVAPARDISAEDLERRQATWWYLLGGALLFLVAETVVSNRLSRTVLSVE